MQGDIYNTEAWTGKFMYTETYNSFDEERVNKISHIIPSDVESILDVGAGGGYIYRRLKDKKGLRCFGIDISLEMVKRSKVQNSFCVGDVKKIPFKDKEFDLVLAADLIEHIKDGSFKESISEMIRVAKRYILINSPHKDTVDWPVSLCNRCKREFNIYGHLRRVDMKLIKSLFPDSIFEMIKSEVFGRRRDLRPYFLVYAARRWGKVYSKEGAICPYCLNPLITKPHRNPLEKFFGDTICAIFFLMDRLMPSIFKNGDEMYVLLRKKETR